jgi:hypothetical protein
VKEDHPLLAIKISNDENILVAYVEYRGNDT